jgi:hypothetical protein
MDRKGRRYLEVEMVASAVLQNANPDGQKEPAGQQEPALERGEMIERYRRLREISMQHHHAILKLIPRDAMLRCARSVGLANGNTLVYDSEEELTLVFDLAIYTAPADRTRAVERYARSARFASGSDEAAMLEAMCNARFAIMAVRRRHPVAGLIVTDLFRHTELWMMDEGFEISVPEGAVLATRYIAPDRFVMTTGASVPVDLHLLARAIKTAPLLMRKSRADALDDRRFAEAVYSTAIAEGVMDGVRYDGPFGVGNAA